jgi:predicted Zn-dependent peptidase
MYKKIILSDGLRLVLVPMKGSQSTTALVLSGAGSKYETKNINGISHFLEHLFFKGTKKRPNTLAIYEALDRVGGEYNAFTGKECTGYYAKVAPEYLDIALDWVADILLNSKFEENEINKEKGVIIEEINMIFDNPMRYVGHLWEELLYGDQPAGWDVIGTKETITKLSRQQLLDYFTAHYKTQNAVVCLSGKTPSGTLLKNKVSRYFGKMAKGKTPEKLAVKEKQKKSNALIYFKETDQTHLCLGVRAYDIFHKDRYVLAVLSAILGGMMSSRLFISVREKKGLAYYVRASAENYTDSGYLVTQAGVANDKVTEAIEAILVEYKKVKNKIIGAAEIKKAKDYLKGITRLNLETSDEVGGWVGIQEVLKKEILTPKQLFGKIESVKADDLQRVARDIFRPEKLNLAIIGPFKEGGAFEKILIL